MEAYENLALLLADAGITKSNMFGMPVLKLGKKPICGLASDGVNFKIDPTGSLYPQVLNLSGAHLFSPEMNSGKTMTMKNWVVVPFVHHDRYLDLAAESIRVVEAEVAKKSDKS